MTSVSWNFQKNITYVRKFPQIICDLNKEYICKILLEKKYQITNSGIIERITLKCVKDLRNSEFYFYYEFYKMINKFYIILASGIICKLMLNFS